MAEMRDIYFEKGELKTQYVLMVRQGNVWAVHSAVWAYNDGDAAKKGAEIVGVLQEMFKEHKNSVFTVMKMLSTNGVGDM